MAKHGASLALKRLNAARKVSIPKKDKVWIVKPCAGSHEAKESVALSFLLRNLLGVASNAREAGVLIKGGKVLVDGRKIKNPKFPVSYMDVVHIPDVGMTYYIDLDSKGRLIAKRDERGYKLSRVEGKRTIRGGKTQFTLDDGRTFISGEGYKVGDTLKVSLSKFKVEAHYPLEVGAECVVLDGGHAGEHGRIVSIVPGTPSARSKVRIESGGEEYTTFMNYVFVKGAGGS